MQTEVICKPRMNKMKTNIKQTTNKVYTQTYKHKQKANSYQVYTHKHMETNKQTNIKQESSIYTHI